MNYLAHIYLSGTNVELMLGNFMADSIKGQAWKTYPLAIQQGIHLHRAIDDFTDSHAIVKQSKNRLWHQFGHYHAVIVDIFYDHFLAKNWEHYHPEPLFHFVASAYQTLETHSHLLPDKTRQIFKFMQQHNWLYNYRHLAGIQTVLSGMAHRTRFNSGMERATLALKEDYEAFAYEFESFFPLLRQFVQQKLTEL